MRYFELVPAYGRDYKNAKDVKAAFNEGKDFEGDMQLGFKLCNKEQLDAEFRPYTANLRYKKLTQIANVVVK